MGGRWRWLHEWVDMGGRWRWLHEQVDTKSHTDLTWTCHRRSLPRRQSRISVQRKWADEYTRTSQPHNLLCMCHRRTTSRIEMTTQRMVRAKFSHHCRRQCKRILEVSGQFIRYKNMVQKLNAADSLHSLFVPHKAHRYLTRRSTTTATKTSMTVKTTMPTRSLKLWSSERTSRFVSES